MVCLFLVSCEEPDKSPVDLSGVTLVDGKISEEDKVQSYYMKDDKWPYAIYYNKEYDVLYYTHAGIIYVEVKTGQYSVKFVQAN